MIVECLARGNGKTTYASIGFARSLACGFVPVIRIDDFSVRRENGKPPNEKDRENGTRVFPSSSPVIRAARTRVGRFSLAYVFARFI